MLVVVLSLLVCWCAAEGLDNPADTWQTWLLIEDQVPSGDLLLRRITPKSVFIAPPINKCPQGYRTDAMGRCVKIVKVDQNAQWEFFLNKLNSMFAFPGAEPSSSSSASANSVPGSNEEDRGPFQVSIPFTKQNNTAKEPASSLPTEAPSPGSTISVTTPTGADVSVNPQDLIDSSSHLQSNVDLDIDSPPTTSEFSDVNTNIVTTESSNNNHSSEESFSATDERTTIHSSTNNNRSNTSPSNSSSSSFNTSPVSSISSNSSNSYNMAPISSDSDSYSSAPISSSSNSYNTASSSSSSNIYQTAPIGSSGSSISYQTSPISSSSSYNTAPSSSSSYNSAPISIGGSSYNIAPIRSNSNSYNTAPISSSSNNYNTASTSNIYNTAPIYGSSSSYNLSPVRSGSNIYNTAPISNNYYTAPISSSSSNVYHTAPISSSGSGSYKVPVYYTSTGDKHNLTSIDVDTAAGERAPSSLDVWELSSSDQCTFFAAYTIRSGTHPLVANTYII